MAGHVTQVLALLVIGEVVLAAVIDARSRTFPLWLAGCMALSCAACAYAQGGFERFLFGFAASVLVCLPLVGFEVRWRRTHGGAAGLGMGDVKFLAALMLAWPLGAVLSFAGGLMLLAIAGALLRRPSLPLIPFIAAAAPLVALTL